MTIVALMFNSQLAKDHPGAIISFYTVSKHISPGICWLIDIACVLDCFGACVGYVQTTGMMLSKTLLELTSWTVSQNTLSLYIKLIMVAILGPFCFSRGISQGAILSAIGLACIGYVCVMPLVYIADSPENVITPLLPSSFMGSLARLPVFFFAFSCMQNLFSVVNDIDNFTVKRVNTVCVSAVSTGLVIYLIVMCVPFAAYGINTKMVFLDNYPQDKVPIQIALIATAIQVSIGYVLVLHPTRQSVLSLWYRETEPEARTEKKLRYIVTGILIVGTLGLALLTNDLDIVTSFTGLLGANTYCFTAPSYMFFLRYHPKHYAKYDAIGESVMGNMAVTYTNATYRRLWYLSIGCLALSAILYPLCLVAIIYELATK
jgi:amino acid permease